MRLLVATLCHVPSYHRHTNGTTYVTCVIFAKDLQRLIGRRRSFMIEVVDAFLPGDHGESLSLEEGPETGRDMLGQDQPDALRSGYPLLSYSRQISSLS